MCSFILMHWSCEREKKNNKPEAFGVHGWGGVRPSRNLFACRSDMYVRFRLWIRKIIPISACPSSAHQQRRSTFYLSPSSPAVESTSMMIVVTRQVARPFLLFCFCFVLPSTRSSIFDQTTSKLVCIDDRLIITIIVYKGTNSPRFPQQVIHCTVRYQTTINKKAGDATNLKEVVVLISTTVRRR